MGPTVEGEFNGHPPASRSRTAGEEQPLTEPPGEGLTVPRGPWWLVPAATLAVGVVVTIALALITQAQYDRNERRLLHLRVRDAGSLIIATVPATQTPLAAAAALADATDGDVRRFRRFVAGDIGPAPAPFVSLSLWRLSALSRGPVAVVGAPPGLAGDVPARDAFLAHAAPRPMVSLIALLSGAAPRLGYAFGTGGRGGAFVVYGEKRVPADRRSQLAGSSAFAGLTYAIYFGDGQDPRSLIVTSERHPPLRGLTAAETVPYGDGRLTLVMGAHGSLAGWVPQALPWIIAVAGGLLTSLAMYGTARVSRRRRDAERLAGAFQRRAGESRRLYARQRDIAQTLQHALLPELPELPGLTASARYDAGERGVEIGGDWYDLIDRDGAVLLVVGDVSGHGLPAATTMASLRYAIHAYAAQDDAPTTILARLCRLMNLADSGHFATILLAQIDPVRRTVTVASAGHLPPLLLAGDSGSYVESPVGLPIGVDPQASYQSATVDAPAGATLIAYTDGLVERRGESLDRGLARLRTAAAASGGSGAPLPELLERLVAELPGGPSGDDIAILGVRWTG